MTEIILASGSSARRKMLEAAGVEFRVVPADVDEEAIRPSLGPASPEEVAHALACAKAVEVSGRHPDALVIGADQVLAVGGSIYTKSPDLAAARNALRSLSGRTHRLLSAVVVVRKGAVTWQYLGVASMTMRRCSDAFLDDYIARAGDRICNSVGAYELEGLGIQLFERIDGDYFTILGMPLLNLLTELRQQGALAR